jgi:hypothetical protein
LVTSSRPARTTRTPFFGDDDEDLTPEQLAALAIELGLRGNDIDFNRPISVEIPAADVEAAALRETTLVAQARTLVDWVGRSRIIGRDGALRHQDVDDLLPRLGIPDSDWPAADPMWEINAMVVPWVTTTRSGMLVMKGRRVRQGRLGRLAGIFESADEAETQVEIGRKAARVVFDLLLGDAQLIDRRLRLTSCCSWRSLRLRVVRPAATWPTC